MRNEIRINRAEKQIVVACCLRGLGITKTLAPAGEVTLIKARILWETFDLSKQQIERKLFTLIEL